ncbi:polysaccharide lyase family 7 protein [Vibrio sp. SCSIO 43140]|uniref:polysaccharide lyase family 7 protein n=1 Tax=Vibrio sp. SCSIO 43140 TaxID=2819100 RepID=UPI0021879269|nr:polysaccharide lyase family 7 protein [Vibrio sp. SCSIO 43140]USD63106.1 polysaccharide lyase family 7 protein [Vibrio sp. SCSIO 43140]
MKKTALISCLLLTPAFLAGCGGDSDTSATPSNPGITDPTEPEEPTDPSEPVDPTDPVDPVDPVVKPVAPSLYSKYDAVLTASKLQRSDPSEGDGNKSDVADSDDLMVGYYDEYFYADENTKDLIFKMSGDSNRSELRVNENFDTSKIGVSRTLSTSFQPIDIKNVLQQSVDGDEVTFLQVHNKGTSSDGTGYIPHPLLRVTYELERNGEMGHYWAVLKVNALDCSSGSEHAGSSDCNNAYQRIDLGEANLDAMTDMDITIQEERLVIEVDGVQKLDHDISYWADLLSYFKAGVYNQYDDGDGINTWSEVRFSKLEVQQESFEQGINWDIDQWKITIPVSKSEWDSSESSSSAAEFKPYHCYSSPESEEFVFNNDSDILYHYDSGDISFFKVVDNRVHFATDMGYGTSTSNSSYIRSEFRELFNAQALDTCSTSSDATSWKINDSATGTDVHTLTSTLRIDDYPQISGQDPKVVVGQVHGWEISQALVKLLWEGESKPTRVILNQDFFTDNKKCSDNEDGCDDWPFSVEMGTYAANEEWQYQITVDDNGITLMTQKENGEGKVERFLGWGAAYSDTKDGDTITMSTDWAEPEIAYYFKAGLYPQFKPDSDNAGQRFEASFSQIEIEHTAN